MKPDATTIIDYTYDQFKAGITAIGDQIEYEGYSPDLIVGVVRGGAVPAVHLSHKLKKPVEMVYWSLSTHCKPNEAICKALQQGKRVLIVDDIIDGGDTIRTLLESLEAYSNKIKVATLWYNTAQVIKPDYFHKVIDRNEDSRWIVYPWEC